ncbi:MAG: DUF3576 domain-containing protein [Acidimicrobiales bacterium]|nr:DUF3576 domain-containing protein [Hyphomonadaceae bacterium]RZV44693.1 MAG: DUF3576 domain-containing protein [Acidimicrobiales bacterium]
MSLSSTTPKFLRTAALAAVLTVGLSACSTVAKVIPGKQIKSTSTASGTYVRGQTTAPRMGVNEFLWRASLETLNFMPMAEIDPFGGVIITDWYASPQAPDERFKANVYILDTNLRADALKVSIFKQVRSPSGWNDATVDADTARTIENSILTEARRLYIATVDS